MFVLGEIVDKFFLIRNFVEFDYFLNLFKVHLELLGRDG